MRNLMGRLNARSDEELQRIAAAWLLPGPIHERAAIIAQIMRSMTDLRATRDFWTRCSNDEWELLGYFIAHDPDEGATIAELASGLGRDQDTIRATATRLYRHGVLAATTRQHPMPSGEMPRLFLPRESGQLFARIRDELDAGDISQIPPATLLELLDDTDIQRAAEIWGLESIPGLRTRRELTEGLLEFSSYPDRRATVERKLGWDARRILAQIAELPVGQTIPLTDIEETLELDPEQPRTAERLRNALSELEEALLVWHTWLPDGTRALFQPIWQAVVLDEHRNRAHPPDPIDGVPLSPVIQDTRAVAWDLLTLLRWLGAGTSALASLSSATIRARRQLDPSLWNRGDDEPRPGYLEFLVSLADAENLLDPPELESRISKTLRAWRNRSFSEQTGQLIAWWLGAVTWIEAQDQEEVIVSGAHWPQFRRRLLVLLAELEPARWYALEELIRWLSRRSSDALGHSVQIATARPIDTSLDRSAERLSSLEQVVERLLGTGFAWFGLVAFGHIPGIGPVLRVSDAGFAAAGIHPPVEQALPEGAALIIHPDLTVTLRAPSPVRVWSLTAFAEQVRLKPAAEFRISNRSLQRALLAGFDTDDVITFLERQGETPLDEHVRNQLRTWAETMGRVWLEPALFVQAEQSNDTRSLRGPLESVGLRITVQNDGLLVQGEPGMTALILANTVETVLREQGKTPQFRDRHDLLTDTRSAESGDATSGL